MRTLNSKRVFWTIGERKYILRSAAERLSDPKGGRIRTGPRFG